MEKNNIMDEVLGDTLTLNTSDLYSADFRTTFRGFDKTQVTSLLERAADAFDQLQRQVEELKKTTEAQKEQIVRYEAMEQTLVEALANAQKLGENTIEQARREAELIREDARLAREAALNNAGAVPEALRDEVNHLRAMRKRLKADLRAVLDIHGALLRGDGESKLEFERFAPADGAAYLIGGGEYDQETAPAHGHDADITVIEPDHEETGYRREE
ncbi:MAG: DivIVA domain-containing protein [Candidatus Hydrogenedentes bacterium]|nr:DivIVA domain-containing protein [Candidatus Hydrogenedentota bacterium]